MEVNVHRCRFIEYQPAQINSLSHTETPTLGLVACGRSNGNIEIWTTRNNWNLLKIIPGGEGRDVNSVVWVNQHSDNTLPRLFSAGSNGLLVEWDTISLEPKVLTRVSGGSITCMSVNHGNTFIALGSTDGATRIFDITNPKLPDLYKTIKPGKPSQVLSIVWTYDDKYIITGSSDGTIKKWDSVSGRTISTMTVETRRKSPTPVTSVIALPDNTIVSGDALGHVKFWDGEQCSMLQTFNKSHLADVLCIASNRDGTEVYTSGVDRKTVKFRKVDDLENTGSIWIETGKKGYHSHDVRNMILIEVGKEQEVLVSGGTDPALVVCPTVHYPNVTHRRLQHFPQKPMISISKSKRLLACPFDNGEVLIWKLGKYAYPKEYDVSAQDPSSVRLSLAENKSLIMKLVTKSKQNVVSCAISEDANWIAVASIDSVGLYRMGEDMQRPGHLKRPKKMKSFIQEVIVDGKSSTGAHRVLFTPDSGRLITVASNSVIIISDLTMWVDGVFPELARFTEYASPSQLSITSISTSGDNKWLAVADDMAKQINIYSLDSYQLHMTLPQLTPASCLHTSLAFNPYSSTLVITFANNQFYVYDVSANALTQWSEKYANVMPARFARIQDKIMGCAFNPENSNHIVLWGSGYLCSIDMQLEIDESQLDITVKKRKREANTVRANENYRLSHHYQGIMLVEFIGEKEMVVVERPYTGILENLGPSFYRPQYGT
ncbi:2021_t:CDS:1 [Paraglomus brasilianum]|uniref:2021_t:CDS:1 n=1 Tax=Paraglomus brasilianum TaxID=144538 RepID=A0A9N8WDR8_9GLOM|nr:2021_t:CDS:1 [Paraglomus brasilianum]